MEETIQLLTLKKRAYPVIFDPNKVGVPTDVKTQFVKNQEQSDYWGNSMTFNIPLESKPVGVFSHRSARRLHHGVATIKI